MFRKVIPYTDYNGVERKEEFSFNFTKAEIWDLNLRTPGGLKAFYERIIATEDGQELADQFKMLIHRHSMRLDRLRLYNTGQGLYIV